MLMRLERLCILIAPPAKPDVEFKLNEICPFQKISTPPLQQKNKRKEKTRIKEFNIFVEFLNYLKKKKNMQREGQKKK